MVNDVGPEWLRGYTIDVTDGLMKFLSPNLPRPRKRGSDSASVRPRLRITRRP